MIQIKHDRLPAGFRATEWIAVGPAWSGIGEWRRANGLRLHIGGRAWQVTWQRGDSLLNVAAAGARITEIFGRRP